ncbi:UbiA prenyltransferase family-domain-containing protein [Crucibulum laeve]|uniref:UbiA prenyltransferase family-domain-containing protein n=1 Tax=Crucibulum laeve TaxID=68775 RepID=A0A5C3M0K9_9AGAR|nr:UbiA prenyltransferase family-domain-containing protein [Crucibulum laeve]
MRSSPPLANFSAFVRIPPISFNSPFEILHDITYTAFLFTYTDYKTILFPITVFAYAAASNASNNRFLEVIIWIWIHLLQCNVSNQYKSIDEDLVNRPWRPLPARRITLAGAKILRWALVPLCMLHSARYGKGVTFASGLLTITTVVYDEFGGAGHWIGKNASAVFGYGSFEIGATIIMGNAQNLDSKAVCAIACSALVIFTTIHAQDCADVEGDRALNRVTFPIYAPEASRVTLFLALIIWSIFLGQIWDISIENMMLLCVFGSYIGWRYYCLRSVEADKRSYLIYNIWLFSIHLLPAISK